MTCPTPGHPSACRTLAFVGRRGPNFTQPISGYADSRTVSEDRSPRSKLAQTLATGQPSPRPEGTKPDRSPSRTPLVGVPQWESCGQGVNPGSFAGGVR